MVIFFLLKVECRCRCRFQNWNSKSCKRDANIKELAWHKQLFNPWSIDLKKKKETKRNTPIFLSFISIGFELLLLFCFIALFLWLILIYIWLSDTLCFIINHHVFLPHKRQRTRERERKKWSVLNRFLNGFQLSMSVKWKMRIRNSQIYTHKYIREPNEIRNKCLTFCSL